jgi:S-adenosylmethionine synthetase
MIRVAEFVLPGHPDKFCDAVADAIIAEVLKVDADGYGQVEVSVWSYRSCRGSSLMGGQDTATDVVGEARRGTGTGRRISGLGAVDWRAEKSARLAP